MAGKRNPLFPLLWRASPRYLRLTTVAGTNSWSLCSQACPVSAATDYGIRIRLTVDGGLHAGAGRLIISSGLTAWEQIDPVPGVWYGISNTGNKNCSGTVYAGMFDPFILPAGCVCDIDWFYARQGGVNLLTDSEMNASETSAWGVFGDVVLEKVRG